MPWEPIHKMPGKQAVVPNLWDYEEVRSSFTWDAARDELDGLPGGGLNIAYEAVDRHLAHGGAINSRCAGSARTVRFATSATAIWRG